MSRYVCVHGHFYQPPREDPWLDSVEPQPSAAPHRDWNERITAECYAPNAAAEILGDNGSAGRLVNNYSKISFNFGPTLLRDLERRAPEVYAAILEGDGGGRALAQPYSHPIMPLADARDRRTQVLWGMRDFEYRFGHSADGMWLPETAVDLASLTTLAECGIRYTVLEPTQARRWRADGRQEWQSVGDGGIDSTRAYRQQLRDGLSIALFFYDAPISRAIAFERLLDSGAALTERLLAPFEGDAREEPFLVNVATDGETYGHHHKFGEMALAWALDRIGSGDRAEPISYGAFLARHPPTHEVSVRDRTSWSCSHGVERWRADCGCCTGARPEWNQSWRAPLREALEQLRVDLARAFEQQAAPLLLDPWEARNGFIDVILDGSSRSRDRFLGRHARGTLDTDSRGTVWRLLEMQRNALLMFSSCGWFHDDLAGIETVQILRYAARAVELAREVGAADPEPEFVRRLALAHSNRPEKGAGDAIYRAAAYS